MHLRFLNLLGRGDHQRRVRLEPIQRGYLAGQRAQRRYVNVALPGDLLQPRIVVLELCLLGAELVVVGNLLQHPGIGAGDSREAERANRRPGQKNVEILDGNGNLPKLSGFVARYEKDVETFTQYPNLPGEKILLRKPAGAERSC